MYRTLDAPLSVHIEMNTSCNQRCRHCYNFWRNNAPNLKESLSKPLIVRIAEQLVKHRVFHAILTGGEPLLNAASLILLIDELKKKKITFSLNSNLALLTPELAEKLKSVGLSSVLTSLLSYDETTHDYLSSTQGSFRRIMCGIDVARRVNIKVAVNMVVMKNNLMQIEETGRFVHKLGAFSFSATRVITPRSQQYQFSKELLLTSDDIQLIVKQMLALKDTKMRLDSLIPYPTCFFGDEIARKMFIGRACSAGKTSLAIASDGSIRACTHHEKVYGSLISNDLNSVWLQMQEWRDGSLLPEFCRSCRLLPKCGGGCRMASKEGDICEKDSIMNNETLPEFSSATKEAHTPTLRNDTGLFVKRSCRFRKDREIGIINTGGIRNTLLSPETLTLLEKLHAENVVFTPDSFQKEYNIVMNKDRYLFFLKSLISKNVLTIVTAQ